MNEAQALDIAREAIYALLIVSSPLMLIGLVVGLVIAVFQALTQIQEVTLTFVPKIIIIFLAMLVLLPFMLRHLQDLTLFLMDRIVAIG
ncbi:MAG TPA: flagellar biosynthetic protein FliQ [Rhodospirillaceae bacterium]|jgi:flagellar biosynthetic protein FliQ|nr:flagellar biosynthetic protein FliQ [Rhodospirillaceae bacterium]MAX62101.1 flagellar biosynthetic protein FliQ [Rhodospirillaceae bacterium]MBB58071.1 flagellar biosynthetic protein FliQ [Rhodospirillaceae bacterium]HAE00057.1 flagellar biosynthetic protein FliQ [Rhodospirillaceae bacterium]HAJ19812.1 flagellar biosynthetic protein FliQ [Rhodospirillaceae bacterium]|tara:strand:+ start:1312 stop:1578 length:267 start_codon:yes stop_codon:yes gene_type:complete